MFACTLIFHYYSTNNTKKCISSTSITFPIHNVYLQLDKHCTFLDVSEVKRNPQTPDILDKISQSSSKYQPSSSRWGNTLHTLRT